MSTLHNPLSMNRLVETSLVFPRLICRSQMGVGLPAFSGHSFNFSIIPSLVVYDSRVDNP